MPAVLRESAASAVLDGQGISNLLSARWSIGHDLQVSEAELTVATRPGFAGYYQYCTLTVQGTARWSGLLTHFDYSLYPRSVRLVLRDPLFRAQQYMLPGALTEGMHLADLTGGPATDQAIVTAVLSQVGIASYIGGIGGTGRTLGTIAPEEFTWKPNETALSYIQRIDAVSLGYRTYWDGGSIVRLQLSSVPSGSPSHTFTEGEDIADGTGGRTVFDSYNAVRVGGYAVGDFLDPRIWYATGGYQSGVTRVFNFDSPMIERRAEASPGSGLSCEAVANYWLDELDREIVRVQMRTPLNGLYLPTQVHRVEGTSSRLGVTGGSALFWVQRVDGEWAPSGAFSQTLTYLGEG